MTDEQLKKAEYALQMARVKEMCRQLALWKRESCIQNVSFYRLPYRLLMDMYSHDLQPPDEVPLNKFYPAQRRSLDCLRRIQQRHNEISNGDFAYFLHLIPPRPDQAERDKISKQITEEEESKEHTPEGKRDYFFTSFLEYCDIDGLKNFELTGNPISQEEENKLKSEYKRRLNDFRTYPERYSKRVLKKDDTTIYEESEDRKHEETT